MTSYTEYAYTNGTPYTAQQPYFNANAAPFQVPSVDFSHAAAAPYQSYGYASQPQQYATYPQQQQQQQQQQPQQVYHSQPSIMMPVYASQQQQRAPQQAPVIVKRHNPYATGTSTPTITTPLTSQQQAMQHTGSAFSEDAMNLANSFEMHHSNSSTPASPAGMMLMNQSYHSTPTQYHPYGNNNTASNTRGAANNNNNMNSSSFQSNNNNSNNAQQLQPTALRTKFATYAPATVTTEELMQQQGNLVELARTAQGSSFVQTAIRDGPEHEQNLVIVANELLPAVSDLLLDAHGCYVIKSVMEKLNPPQLAALMESIAADESLLFSMCTHSLHTRRVVQYLMDTVDVSIFVNILVARCEEIATTQQGCIVMQKGMDIAQEPHRSRLFSAVYSNLLQFAVDPFANYVVQHMLEVGDKDSNSAAVQHQFRGHVMELSCNKFSSNVMEKCLFHLNAECQHDIVVEMYDVDEETLHAMLQDSFGNYIIQSSIALAAFKDVFFIAEKLRAVLQRTPYGHKIEARLERRLKGKPVGTRSPQIGANSKTGATTTVSNASMTSVPSSTLATPPAAIVAPQRHHNNAVQQRHEDAQLQFAEEPW